MQLLLQSLGLLAALVHGRLEAIDPVVAGANFRDPTYARHGDFQGFTCAMLVGEPLVEKQDLGSRVIERTGEGQARLREARRGNQPFDLAFERRAVLTLDVELVSQRDHQRGVAFDARVLRFIRRPVRQGHHHGKLGLEGLVFRLQPHDLRTRFPLRAFELLNAGLVPRRRGLRNDARRLA